ncbi:MAG: hypothetical protein GY874_12600 [Desulfobacteraceae bacterium]|nr:hypothetical protein [Desulfobacteraceae bacterium]
MSENKNNIGIPEDMRIKRRYTMSDEALEQRRKAAKQPKPGMLGIAGMRSYDKRKGTATDRTY